MNNRKENIMKVKKIVRNMAKCNHCGEIIESKHTHDFRWCSCKTVAVDGGKSYLKRSFVNSPADFTDMSEWEEVEVHDKPEVDDFDSYASIYQEENN